MCYCNFPRTPTTLRCSASAGLQSCCHTGSLSPPASLQPIQNVSRFGSVAVAKIGCEPVTSTNRMLWTGITHPDCPVQASRASCRYPGFCCRSQGKVQRQRARQDRRAAPRQQTSNWSPACPHSVSARQVGCCPLPWGGTRATPAPSRNCTVPRGRAVDFIPVDWPEIRCRTRQNASVPCDLARGGDDKSNSAPGELGERTSLATACACASIFPLDPEPSRGDLEAGLVFFALGASRVVHWQSQARLCF